MNNPNLPFLRVKTPSFAHNSLAFSPFFENRLAVASGANFGLVGNGRVHILELGQGPNAGMRVTKWFDTRDCVYDVAWNESHENQVIAACGNGALKLFDTTLAGLPIQAWHEHAAEVMCVDWNNIRKNTFATASWDQTVKIWDTSRATSLLTLPAHQAQIYTSKFSPHSPDLLLTTSQDASLKVFDLRAANPVHPVQAARTTGEVLDGDWNKYDDSVIAFGGKEGVGIWDLRKGVMEGGMKHGLAIRKVAWSPFQRDLLASTSYDMTCRCWRTLSTQSRPEWIHSHHKEFVMGVAWALFEEGIIASASWDEEVHLYKY